MVGDGRALQVFRALAAGRPVLFAGPRDAAIARWIEEYGVGWVLDSQTQGEVVAQLRSVASTPETLAEMQRHCQRVYQEHFSRSRVMDGWHRELMQLLPQGATAVQPSTPIEMVLEARV